MNHVFPSHQWVTAFQERVNSSAAYQESGAHWDAGAVCLIIKANSGVGLAEDQYIYLDLDHGRCQHAKLVGRALTGPRSIRSISR